MNFFSNFVLSVLLPVTVVAVNAEEQNSMDRYDAIVDKSAHDMGKCIEITNKLEVLKSELVMLLKSINSDATNINSVDNPQSTEEILKNIATICKLLQKTVNDKINKENEEDAVKLSKEMPSDGGDVIGQYEAITKILVSLHERIYKLIIKFNMLQKSMEDTMAEISHDLRNINSTMNSKEEAVKDSTEDLNKLKSEVKEVIKSLEEGTDECKKHFDNIKKSNTKSSKKNLDDKSDGNNKKDDKNDNDNKTKEKDTDKKSDKKSDDNIPNTEEKDKETLDKKNSENKNDKTDKTKHESNKDESNNNDKEQKEDKDKKEEQKETTNDKNDKKS